LFTLEWVSHFPCGQEERKKEEEETNFLFFHMVSCSSSSSSSSSLGLNFEDLFRDLMLRNRQNG